MVSKRWTWLAGFALLFAGFTNAHSHVHYCFDGQEPAAAVHIVDSTAHHHDDAPGHSDDAPGHSDDADHDDLDVDVPNQALTKAVKYDLTAIPVLAWTMTFDPLPGATLANSVDSPPHPNPRYALPQLRAPPR